MSNREKELRDYNLELLNENDKLRKEVYSLKGRLKKFQRDYKLLNKLHQTLSRNFKKLKDYVEKVNNGETTN